jgi:hypothetical protein
VDRVHRELSDAERHELVRLTRYAGTARTAVERDGYNYELLVTPQPDGPGRLVIAMRQLLGGMEAIGADHDTAWRVVRRVAADTVPSLRTQMLAELLSGGEALWSQPRRTSDLGECVGMVTKTAHRVLDDLALIGLVKRSKASHADNSPDLWAPTPLLLRLWPRNAPVPPRSETETSGGVHSQGVDGDTPIPSESAQEEESLSHAGSPSNGQAADDSWRAEAVAAFRALRGRGDRVTRVVIGHIATAALVEVSTEEGTLPSAWLGRWRIAVQQATQHVNDFSADDGSTYVAVRVRRRRAGPLLALAEEIRTTP